MSYRLVVTCEHGGKSVPPRYRRLFRGREELLTSHRGHDPGAAELAKLLARRFQSPLFVASVSRLVVELNRSERHPSLFSEITRPLSREERLSILRLHYHPHRRAVTDEIEELVERRHPVLHVASHSFTPVLRGDVRAADVAWLYDPSRDEEKRLCLRWRSALAARLPQLRLRFNYPYRGAADGLTTHLRRRFAKGYLGVELEVNQCWHFGDPRERARLRRAIADSLAKALERAPARSGLDREPIHH